MKVGIWVVAGSRWAVSVFLVFFCSGWIKAQETPLTPSATQPSQGTFLLRQQVRYYYGGGTDQVSLPYSVSTGITRGHSLEISSAGNFTKRTAGVSDLSLVWKWRFHSFNQGPINTSRSALLMGVQVPSGSGGWGTGSFNPAIGISHTTIRGRVGLGGSIAYKFNTGSGAEYDVAGTNSQDDAFVLSGAVMWRVVPAEYTKDSKGVWYLGSEGEFVQSGSGTSIRLGQSLMYEAETWVFEAGCQIYPLNTGAMEDVGGMFFTGAGLFFKKTVYRTLEESDFLGELLNDCGSRGAGELIFGELPSKAGAG